MTRASSHWSIHQLDTALDIGHLWSTEAVTQSPPYPTPQPQGQHWPRAPDGNSVAMVTRSSSCLTLPSRPVRWFICFQGQMLRKAGHRSKVRRGQGQVEVNGQFVGNEILIMGCCTCMDLRFLYVIPGRLSGLVMILWYRRHSSSPSSDNYRVSVAYWSVGDQIRWWLTRESRRFTWWPKRKHWIRHPNSRIPNI